MQVHPYFIKRVLQDRISRLLIPYFIQINRQNLLLKESFNVFL